MYGWVLSQKDELLCLLNAKPPGAAQPFVPVQSDTAVQARLHGDSWGHPFSGCSGPSCYWCPEGLGTERDPPKSHPDTIMPFFSHTWLKLVCVSCVFVIFSIYLCIHFYKRRMAEVVFICKLNLKSHTIHTVLNLFHFSCSLLTFYKEPGER